MFDRIDAKKMLITDTFLIEQQLMLVFDFVDLLTSRLSNLFLQHSGKGLSQLSCPRHDLPEKGIFHVPGHFVSGKKNHRYFCLFR